MNLRITATYAATDGNMPESVDVAWDDIIVGSTYPTTRDLLVVIDHLIAAPAKRRDAIYEKVTAVDQKSGLQSVAEAGRKFRAGTAIAAGMMVGFASNGFTLYPAGHALSNSPAGVTIEFIGAGEAMEKDESQSSIGRTAWIKERS